MSDRPFLPLLLAALLALPMGARAADYFSVPAAPGAEEIGASPLRLTVEEAVLQALKQNRAFAVERYRPAIARTAEETERAAFDPVLGASLTRSQSRDDSDVTVKSLDGEAWAEQSFATGTTGKLTLSGEEAEAGSADAASARLGLTLTQSLLQGYGTGANLARLREAELDTQISAFELRAYAESLVARVEEAYWNYHLAKRQIEIVAQSLTLAQDQLDETSERIRLGQLAEVERIAAEAEVALRREAEINARSEMESARLSLLNLIGAPHGHAVEVVDPLPVADALDAVDDHAALAQKSRPDLKQARLEQKRGDLEIVRTRNGLLPVLDLFVTLGKSGYAQTFGGATGEIGGDAYDASAGLSLRLPMGRRAERAALTRAELTRAQAEEALSNLSRLAELDVRTAYIEAGRLAEQVKATAATRALREETLRAETEKFRVGRSTSLLVAAAQRDLLESRLAEAKAAVSLRQAIVSLYLEEGSLLARRGIAAPGAEPVK